MGTPGSARLATKSHRAWSIVSLGALGFNHAGMPYPSQLTLSPEGPFSLKALDHWNCAGSSTMASFSFRTDSMTLSSAFRYSSFQWWV